MLNPVNGQLHKMVKHTQTMNFLSVFGHFVGLALKGLNFNKSQPIYAYKHYPYKKKCIPIHFSF